MRHSRDVQLTGAHLQVRFAYREDRFAHEVWLAEGATWICMLRSIEGSPLDDCPASPPLQSLHLERREGGREVALGVGMAGKGHWSASIELDAPGDSTRFEIAWRGRWATAGSLRSSYRLVDATFAGDAERRRIICSQHTTSRRLAIELDEQSPLVEWQCTAEELAIVVPANSSQAGPQTVRWSYRIMVLPFEE